VEGIGVFHQEFARAHDPEARPDLVAELGLDLVKGHRQLLVAAQLVAGEVGDHLFVGRAEHVVASGAVVQFQQLVAEVVPAAGFLPEFRRLHRRHQHSR